MFLVNNKHQHSQNGRRCEGCPGKRPLCKRMDKIRDRLEHRRGG
ncbi:unnamed protein product, partial [Amoebophrya sp. A25]|eukprot:GSA25T00000053001.1